MPWRGECVSSPIGSARSSAVVVSSAMCGTNCRAIGSPRSPRSISAAISGVTATAYRSATRLRSASFSGGARPAATNSDGRRNSFVMPGLVPGIRVFCKSKSVVDGRNKSGHDGKLFRHRRPQHLLDALCTRCQHHQPVESERDAGGLRHLAECCEKIFIERIALAVHPLLLRHFALETPALFGWIGEFAERVGDLDAAKVKLEAFRNLRIVRGRPRQRCFRDGILVEDRCSANAEVRFDPLDENAAEDIRPGIVTSDANALGFRRGGKRLTIIEHCEQIDTHMTPESLGNCQPLGLRERICGATAINKFFRSGRLRSRSK